MNANPRESFQTLEKILPNIEPEATAESAFGIPPKEA